MIVFDCPACKKKLQAADEFAGKNIACPNCKAKATVPTQSQTISPADTAPILNAKTQLAPPPSDTAHILDLKTQLGPPTAPAAQPEGLKKTQLAAGSPVAPAAQPERLKKTQLAPPPSEPAVRPPVRPQTKSQPMMLWMGAAGGLVVLSMCILATAVGVVVWGQKASDPIAKGNADENNKDVGDKDKKKDAPKSDSDLLIKKDDAKKADQKPPLDPGKKDDVPPFEEKKDKELNQPKPGDLIANDIGMKLAWIPPGSFLMGSPENEKLRQKNDTQETQHRVNLTKGFRMGIHAVTQAQWQAVMGNNPSTFKGDDLPVEYVSWNDCVEFCTMLSKRESKNYRLPTEAEWEYACRAGSQTAYHFGADPSNLGGYAWFSENADKKPHPVGQKKPNSWGLYDMHGNAWQWCEDWHDGDYYSNSPGVNPVNTKGGTDRVIRGGSWNSDLPGGCRSACRNYGSPGNRYDGLGFRVVLSSPEEKIQKSKELTGNPKVDDKKEKELNPPKAGDLVANNIGMKFAWIPPGNGQKGFHMGVYAVTQAQWKKIMDDNPSHFKGDNLPVESVSWNDCVAFCAKLSKREGKTYRLPTEKEWEYACRAGSKTRYYFGDNPKDLGDYAWFANNSVAKTHPVGQKKANAWGLFDMHGNIWQWTSSSEGSGRVLRGGCWGSNAEFCSASYRSTNEPGYSYSSLDGLGFRLLAVPMGE